MPAHQPSGVPLWLRSLLNGRSISAGHLSFPQQPGADFMRTSKTRFLYLVLALSLGAGVSGFRFIPREVSAEVACADGSCAASCRCTAEPLLSCRGVTGKKCVCPSAE